MKIFLDDIRIPADCLSYMYNRIGVLNTIYMDEDWHIVRSYPEFITAIDAFKEKITHVSFDHDLVAGHYHQNLQEGVINYDSKDFNIDYNKTGYHAAKYLKEVYKKENLPLPVMFVHSIKPVGTENIINLFKK